LDDERRREAHDHKRTPDGFHTRGNDLGAHHFGHPGCRRRSTFDRQSFEARSFFDEAQSMMRYAQKLAVAQNRNVHVDINGTRFAFCFSAFAADGSCADQVPAPVGANSGRAATLAACANNKSWLCEAIPAGINFAVTPPILGFFFSASGRPSSAATLDIVLNSGGVARHLFVEQETGYVH
jgi:MSHA pilin protein MshC